MSLIREADLQDGLVPGISEGCSGPEVVGIELVATDSDPLARLVRIFGLVGRPSAAPSPARPN